MVGEYLMRNNEGMVMFSHRNVLIMNVGVVVVIFIDVARGCFLGNGFQALMELHRFYREYCDGFTYTAGCIVFNDVAWLIFPSFFYWSCWWIGGSVKDGLLGKDGLRISERIVLLVMSVVFVFSMFCGLALHVFLKDGREYISDSLLLTVLHGVVMYASFALLMACAYLAFRKALVGKI